MAIIEVQGFEKRFGKLQAVSPLDLSIEEGETFALLGPNGSGKSTLIRALVGLQIPSGGRILIKGVDIAENPQQGRRLTAYMPQRVSPPESLTAREMVRFFADLREVESQRVDEALEFVGLTRDADRRVRGYSGGMVQRLGLAIAFLQDVPIYVLDEPTLNLDAVGTDRFRAKVQELKHRGATIVFSSHILQDAAQLADRVGILVGGRLVHVETIASFRDLLAQETDVRVVLESVSEGMVAAAVDAGARTSAANGRQYAFKAPPSRRLDVIRAIETAGGVIEEFHTETPEWETLIKKRFAFEEGRP